MAEFEPWQRHIIEQVRRSMPNLPKITFRRERLPDGALGHTYYRAWEGYLVLLDPPPNISIGAFRYLVRHECEHVRQGAPALRQACLRVGVSKADLDAFDNVLELAADRAVEAAGYREDMLAFVRQSPKDRLRNRTWERAVAAQWTAARPRIVGAVEAHLARRKKARAGRPPVFEFTLY